MADTVDVRTVYTGPRVNIIQLQGVSDGTGENGVTKVDISTFNAPNGKAATYTQVLKIEYSIFDFGSVRLHWDHTTNDELVTLADGYGVLCFENFGGLVDPRTAGDTGDILLTTPATVTGGSYDITLYLKFKN